MLSRRCMEDKYNFDEPNENGIIDKNFPIQMSSGGASFGFCPAKVLRDDLYTVSLYKTLVCILETGTWPSAGGLDNQAEFWIDLVAEFAPYRRQVEFHQRFTLIAKAILGDKKGGAQKAITNLAKGIPRKR